MRFFLEMSLEISFDSETFRTKFSEISRAISLENSREQRTKFVEIHLHYFCTILYFSPSQSGERRNQLNNYTPWSNNSEHSLHKMPTVRALPGILLRLCRAIFLKQLYMNYSKLCHPKSHTHNQCDVAQRCSSGFWFNTAFF